MKRFDYKKWVVEKKYSKLLLTEQEAEEKPEEDSSGLIDISAGPEAILQAAAKIPQKTLYAGRTDGKPDDEKIQINPDSATANTLIPTQNAIGSAQSLDDQITDKSYGGSSQLDQALNDDKISSQTGTFPILTLDKKYILDGHHRWSQFLATNPNASVDIADISAPGVDNADEAIARGDARANSVAEQTLEKAQVELAESGTDFRGHKNKPVAKKIIIAKAPK